MMGLRQSYKQNKTNKRKQTKPPKQTKPHLQDQQQKKMCAGWRGSRERPEVTKGPRSMLYEERLIELGLFSPE